VSNDGKMWAAAHETWLDDSQNLVTTSIYVCNGDACQDSNNWTKQQQMSNQQPSMTFRGMIASG
jgi:hypothetical protein